MATSNDVQNELNPVEPWIVVRTMLKMNCGVIEEGGVIMFICCGIALALVEVYLKVQLTWIVLL